VAVCVGVRDGFRVALAVEVGPKVRLGVGEFVTDGGSVSVSTSVSVTVGEAAISGCAVSVIAGRLNPPAGKTRTASIRSIGSSERMSWPSSATATRSSPSTCPLSGFQYSMA
jgi:hypothetical protein